MPNYGNYVFLGFFEYYSVFNILNFRCELAILFLEICEQKFYLYCNNTMRISFDTTFILVNSVSVILASVAYLLTVYYANITKLTKTIAYMTKKTHVKSKFEQEIN